MFPFVHFSRRPWIGPTLLVASLALLSLTSRFLDIPPTSPTVTASSDIEYLAELENHLQAKAAQVVERFTSEDYTIDLCLELDTVQTTTTSYQPGEKILVQSQEKRETLDNDKGYENCVSSQKWELTGTWTESADVRPRIAAIRCCVTLARGQSIDHDHLYQRLSYALGLDLERGDLLKIVER